MLWFLFLFLIQSWDFSRNVTISQDSHSLEELRPEESEVQVQVSDETQWGGERKRHETRNVLLTGPERLWEVQKWQGAQPVGGEWGKGRAYGTMPLSRFVGITFRLCIWGCGLASLKKTTWRGDSFKWLWCGPLGFIVVSSWKVGWVWGSAEWKTEVGCAINNHVGSFNEVKGDGI